MKRIRVVTLVSPWWCYGSLFPMSVTVQEVIKGLLSALHKTTSCIFWHHRKPFHANNSTNDIAVLPMPPSLWPIKSSISQISLLPPRSVFAHHLLFSTFIQLSFYLLSISTHSAPSPSSPPSPKGYQTAWVASDGSFYTRWASIYRSPLLLWEISPGYLITAYSLTLCVCVSAYVCVSVWEFLFDCLLCEQWGWGGEEAML